MQFVSNPFDFTISFQKWGKRADKAHTYWCCACGEEYCHDELTDLRPNPKYDYRNWYSYRKTIATCPHCGKKMEIQDNWCRAKNFEDIVGVHATIGEWCVDRYFVLYSYTARGEKERVRVEEIGQAWSKEEGKPYIFFAHRGGFMSSRYWKHDEPFHFMTYLYDGVETNTWWSGRDDYEYPADFSLDAELAKYHIDMNNLHGMPLLDVMACMSNPHFETLWKAGEYELCKFFKNKVNTYWPQIKIARRQGYKIEDLIMWRDMIDMLRNVRDIHSPKYICPANLEQAHANAQILHNRFLHKDDWEKNKVYDKALRERIQRFMDMDIKDDNIQIIVLPSVKAFKDETDHLGHCVYTCGYYKKDSSLILSARDKENINKRWETIEVDLNTFKILQCYGYGDKFTERHNEILGLMNSNMWQIKQRVEMA